MKLANRKVAGICHLKQLFLSRRVTNMKKQWYEVITMRGWIVIGIIGFIALVVLMHATGDICWTGNGYGSCQKLIEEVTK
jgi:hypothetical protein